MIYFLIFGINLSCVKIYRMNETIKTLIVDDDDSSIKILNSFCAKIPEVEVIGEFKNPLKAVEYLDKNDVDLIFLDIHMPEINGIELIEISTKLPNIIITTSDENFALVAFEYDVEDYLLKPITFPRFLKSINKIKKKINASHSGGKQAPKEIFINVNRKLKRVIINEINIIEAKGDYVLIRTEDENLIVHSTMKKMEDTLPSDKFVKVHRSYIINTAKIKDIEDNSVLIETYVIPISRSKKDELFKKLNKL